MIVQVTKTPGPVQSFSIESGATVRQTLDLAGITSFDGYRIEVDGATRDLNDEIFNGDTVILVKQIKGNS